MLDRVPDMVFAIGYTNASWTLKVDLVAQLRDELLRFMRRPRLRHGDAAGAGRAWRTSPYIDMSSGYFERSRQALPLQGDRVPWRLRQHYFKDAALYRGPVDERELVFGRAAQLAEVPG